jgi:hypothetical protein
MKQQSQVNSGDIQAKVVQAVRLSKRKVKKMSFEFFFKIDRMRKGK